MEKQLNNATTSAGELSPENKLINATSSAGELPLEKQLNNATSIAVESPPQKQLNNATSSAGESPLEKQLIKATSSAGESPLEKQLINVTSSAGELPTEKQLKNATSSAGEWPPEKRIQRCNSPPLLSAQSTFSWFDEDIWTEIAKFLDGKSLIMLAATNRWFRRAIMDEDAIWKFACLRDLRVPSPQHVAFKWSQLYASAFDGSHSYKFREPENHIAWDRIGAFSFESSVAFLSERLAFSTKIKIEETIDKMLKSNGCCWLGNIKPGIWIADSQLVRCSNFDNITCDGIIQTLDARHIELFLCEGYKNGSWDYEFVGSHDIKEHADRASAAIIDIKHLNSDSTSVIFNYKSWIHEWQPNAMLTSHAVSLNQNLEENQGVYVKYQAMRAGTDGKVVSIRISHHML